MKRSESGGNNGSYSKKPRNNEDDDEPSFEELMMLEEAELGEYVPADCGDGDKYYFSLSQQWMRPKVNDEDFISTEPLNLKFCMIA